MLSKYALPKNFIVNQSNMRLLSIPLVRASHNIEFYFYANSYYTKSSTTFLVDTIGSIHDLEQSKYQRSGLYLALTVFTSHWGHLAIILLWLSGTMFHIGWSGNYTVWLSNPLIFTPISHSISWSKISTSLIMHLALVMCIAYTHCIL